MSPEEKKILFCRNDPAEYTEEVKKIIKDLLIAVGEDPEREGLKDTPKRVAKAFRETLGGYCKELEPSITVFENDEGYSEMIVDEVYFYSYCEHHMIPFFGRAFIAYIPDKKLVGLSKLSRILDFYSRRLQVQERLTQQVAWYINKKMSPKGVGVVLHARHMCREMRGVKKLGAFMTTSKLLGCFEEDSKTRQEFMSFIQNKLSTQALI